MADAKKPPRIPWLALILMAGLPVGLLVVQLTARAGLSLPPCLLKTVTGLPCATCGMTRMAVALVGGDLAMAFHWHPVAALGLCLSPGVAIWDLHRAWKAAPYPRISDAGWVRGLAIGLFLGVWALQVVRGI